VHFKATPVPLNEIKRLDDLIDQAKSIGMDILLRTPYDLDDELSKLHETLIPEQALAARIAERMKEESEQDLSDE
jgi:uncharacterized protein Yka (UPF0111/DUF47 family)